MLGTCILGAQSRELKRRLIGGAAMFASGMIDGTVESISWHYENGFKPAMPNANDQFWNPAVSWRNKYKNGDPAQGERFPGSTTMFASTTDAYHLLRTSKRTIDGVTLAWYINEECTQKNRTRKQRIVSMVKDFAILTAVRCVGFHLTYTYMFRKREI